MQDIPFLKKKKKRHTFLFFLTERGRFSFAVVRELFWKDSETVMISA